MTYAPRSRSARATGTYANIGLETEVLSASPERLISLLFRGALTAIAQARHHMHTGTTRNRARARPKPTNTVTPALRRGGVQDRAGKGAARRTPPNDSITPHRRLPNR